MLIIQSRTFNFFRHKFYLPLGNSAFLNLISTRATVSLIVTIFSFGPPHDLSFVATAGREEVSFVIGVYFDAFLLVLYIYKR